MNGDWQDERGSKLNGFHVLILCGAGIMAPFIWPKGIGFLIFGWILCFAAIVIGVWLLVHRKCRGDKGLVIFGMVLSGLWLIFTVLQPLWIHLLKQGH